MDSTRVLTDSPAAGGLAADSVAGSELAANSVRGSELLPGAVTMDDIAGVDLSGSIDVGAIADGRCTTFNVSVAGAKDQTATRWPPATSRTSGMRSRRNAADVP